MNKIIEIAAHEKKASEYGISNVLHGKLKKSGGFKWELA
jgi:hypothetical protein